MKVMRLAFSGSGFLGGIHAGAACAAIDSGYQIAEVAGTSGGSIVAAALASGASPDDLFFLACRSDMTSLLTFNPLDMLSTGAYCNGKALFAWLMANTKGKTFVQAAMPCTIVASDVGAGAPFVFSALDTPDLPLALACRASSAVPFVYAPVNLRGKVLADGGMTNNIPVSLLKNDGLPLSLGGDLRVGIDVDEPATFATSPLWAYAGTLVKLLLRSNEETQIHLAANTGAAIIKVPSGAASFLDTSMTVSARECLFDSGYTRMKAYLDTVPR